MFGDIRYDTIFIEISTEISLSNIGNQISIFRYFIFRGTERQASNQKQCANRKLVSYTIPICNFIHSVCCEEQRSVGFVTNLIAEIVLRKYKGKLYVFGVTPLCLSFS